ncbi:hypothetical protein BN8_01171 [Fibrisoma limi BUZ 3]|uniref:Phytase-like domain-containing protein n=1 Tax=Fibrisoma limi BUZ 3 TaxID=1185876 RepID=I2GE69_9BACT|nr:esterase-like activity of phytase family protein [Fibrisoma limi]CCH52194.1 hypothetical protein BN8_01171 [Fibrisoma limi BUZ 3]
MYEDGPRAAFNVAGSPIRIIKYDCQTSQPVTKTLLYDVASSGVPHIDNLEVMTLVLKLPNVNYSLVMVSDDNFGAAQITQFLAFEVLP